MIPARTQRRRNWRLSCKYQCACSLLWCSLKTMFSNFQLPTHEFLASCPPKQTMSKLIITQSWSRSRGIVTRVSKNERHFHFKIPFSQGQFSACFWQTKIQESNDSITIYYLGYMMVNTIEDFILSSPMLNSQARTRKSFQNRESSRRKLVLFLEHNTMWLGIKSIINDENRVSIEIQIHINLKFLSNFHRCYGRNTQGGRGRGVQIDLRKFSFLSVSLRNFFKVSRSFSKDQKWSVNLTFNAVLHRKFSSRHIMLPGGPKEVV